MSDYAPPPSPPGASEHPSVAELSALLDRELANGLVAVTTAHLETCGGCRHELERLMWARQAVASAGQPEPPPGASDRAVVAALFVTSLSLVAQAAREAAGSAEAPASPGLRPSVEPAASAPLPFSAPERPPAPVPIAPIVAPSPPAMPPALSRGHGRCRAAAHGRHSRLAVRAAVAILALGALGGALAAVVSTNHPTPRTAGPVGTTTQKITGGSARLTPTTLMTPTTLTTPTTSRSRGATASPGVGALTLQLRPETGAASCGKALRYLEDVNGNLEVVNPPATKSAVVAVAGSAASRCLTVGPAFATLWSGNVTRVGVTPAQVAPSSGATSGAVVDIVVNIAPATLANSSGLNAARAGGEAIQVIAQGTDLGTAIISSGTAIAFQVSRSMATFLVRQFGAH
ncbi:MAG TPA: hypothetical protein VEH29_07715 [Acidimicrobiales bacterium]|nr:hypothetical protein [Acidimicrobiales bacterium]